MGSGILPASLFLLAVLGKARSISCDSYRAIRLSGGENQPCDSVNSTRNECDTSPKGADWVRAGCLLYQNCTLDLLKNASCQDAGNSSELAIRLDENLPVLLTRTYVFTNWTSFVIEGLGETATVECFNNVGVIVRNVGSVVIRNIKWQNCGGLSFDALEDIELSGALHLFQTTQLSVISSEFVGSMGAGVVAKVRVRDGTESYAYSYLFEDSTFHDSSNLSLSVSHAGGGVAVHVFQYFSDGQPVENETNVSIRLTNCSFSRNTAFSGGGVFVSAFNADGDVAELNMEVEIQMCNFTDNFALATGGAVTVAAYELSQSYISLNNCRFLDNEAVLAGGAVHLGIHAGLRNTYVGFSNCHWESNRAIESSALSVSSLTPKSPIQTLDITNSTMVSNDAQILNYDARCTVQLIGVTEFVLKEVNISDNIGSGLCLHKTVAVIDGNVWITYNHRAQSGGGIFLHRRSYITLTRGSTLTLDGNTAVYGGGLLVSQPFQGICFLNSTEECANVLLLNNQAFFNGASMYIENPDETCVAELEKLCKPGYQRTRINSPVKSQTSFTFNNGTTDVFPGQQIELEANMKDFFGNSGKAIVRVYLHPHHTEYSLMGSTQFTLQDGVNRPNLTVFGPEPDGNSNVYSFEMAALDQQSSNVSQNITLSITKCPVGYNSSSQTCTCSDGVECDDFLGTACVPKGDWFGNFPDNSSPPVLLTCSSGYCSNIGDCEPCTTQGDYCVLRDPQCVQSRVGPLCLECPENSSYTFGAIRCADDKHCQIPGLLTSLFIVIYCVLWFALLFIIMKFTKGITLGALFSFVYYFSIIDLVLPPSIVDNNILSIVYVVQSFTQLNPNFLGLVPICVAKDANILVLQYLLYISPVVVWGLVILLVLCSRRCSKHVKFNDRTPITVISLLILLTFTAFTKTSFNILLPIEFTEVNGTYVNIAPNRRYFASVDHQIFFVVAVVVLVIGVLPFTLFLFLVPFLGQCCNLTRIKPFLDEFQACYKDEYRWMAGFYFLCRIPYFLCQLLHMVVVEEYIAQFISLGVLLLHIMLQPYKLKRLNVIDAILLADVMCFSLLYGSTAEIVFSEVPSIIRDLVSYILILLPVVLMFLLLLVGLHYRYPVLRQYSRHSKQEDKEEVTWYDSSSSVPYREPLLSMDNTFDRVQLTNYENGTSVWDSDETSRHKSARASKGDGHKNRPHFTEISLEVLAESDPDSES